MKRALFALAVVALPGVAAGGQAAPGASPLPAPRNVEARAEQELKRMSDFLAKLPQFALEADETTTAFSQDTIEWQIWIDAGEQPLPRKLVISYVQEQGEP